MHIVLTQFAIDRHFDPEKAGTTITDHTPDEFEREINAGRCACIELWRHGYAPFCELAFTYNRTDARTGTLPITPENKQFLKSGYQSRKSSELPVLTRWFEDVLNVPRAKYLCLVLYSQEQLAKEGTDIDANFGIVAILGQLHDKEEPMTPMTAMRNALGVGEGGSGVAIDREAYMRSVEFWDTHAVVKVGG